MKVGLKNALDLVEDVVDCFDFAINESCIYYEECGVSVCKNIPPRFALRPLLRILPTAKQLFNTPFYAEVRPLYVRGG